MSKTINLSYVLSTKNKLPFLEEMLTDLIRNKKADDEIIIHDGGSSDGTIEYLQKLLNERKIDFFESKPDSGEAHALNKGLLLARGILVKPMTDDDAFFYPGIEKCKKFMLSHPEIDILNTEGAVTDWSKENPFFGSYYYKTFRKWQKNKEPFVSTGLGMMMRKSSLAHLGLYATNVIRVDAEYSLRITAFKKVQFAWYMAPCWVRITNPRSNSIVHAKRGEYEFLKIEKYYLNKSITWEIQQYLNNKWNYIRAILVFILRRYLMFQKQSMQTYDKGEDSIHSQFIKCRKWLTDQNKKKPGKFLF